MAKHIEQLEIRHFRGLNQLNLTNLNAINIIAGDNNSGKTSVLEAMLLLRNPTDVSNILRVANVRMLRSGGNIPLYESFLYLFPLSSEKLQIEIQAQ